MLDDGPGGQERAVEVNGQHFLPVGKCVILDPVDDLDARIRHEHVDAAQPLHRFGHARIDRFFAGYVHRDGERFAALGNDIFSDLLSVIEIQIRDHDRRTV
jgi:hypothetical protein